MAKNTRYSPEYKKEYIKMTNYLRNFVDFERLSKLINSNDARNLEIGLKAIINLSDYSNNNRGSNHINSIKGKYLYKIELPFYKKDNGKVSVIKYIHSGYPYDIEDLNLELILTKAFFNKCTDEQLDEIIVYDFKTMKRYVTKNLNFNFTYIFNILKIVDSKFIYSNSGYICKDCQHRNFCEEYNSSSKNFYDLIRKEKNGKDKEIQQNSTAS